MISPRRPRMCPVCGVPRKRDSRRIAHPRGVRDTSSTLTNGVHDDSRPSRPRRCRLRPFSQQCATGAHTTTASWDGIETEQRLTVGRFAAANGVAHATCLGSGVAVNPKALEFNRYKHLECKVLNKVFENERQLVVHVRTATTFTPQWLTTKECG